MTMTKLSSNPNDLLTLIILLTHPLKLDHIRHKSSLEETSKQNTHKNLLLTLSLKLEQLGVHNIKTHKNNKEIC
jgi:hypothetical protein